MRILVHVTSGAHNDTTYVWTQLSPEVGEMSFDHRQPGPEPNRLYARGGHIYCSHCTQSMLYTVSEYWPFETESTNTRTFVLCSTCTISRLQYRGCPIQLLLMTWVWDICIQSRLTQAFTFCMSSCGLRSIFSSMVKQKRFLGRRWVLWGFYAAWSSFFWT